MNTIEMGKSIYFEKVASYREKINSLSINEKVTEFIEKLKESGVHQNSPIISTTHGVDLIDEEQILDIEFLVAIDRELDLVEPYKFKKAFQLVNAVSKRYVGNPLYIEEAVNEMLEFIQKNQMQQIAPLYNLNISNDSQDTATIDLYIPVNPNIT